MGALFSTQGSHDAAVVAQLRNFVAHADYADLLDYTVDDEHLLSMLQRTGNSAVGPGVVQYPAWRAAPVEVQLLLVSAIRSLLREGGLPGNFGGSLLCFIPKAMGAVEMGGDRVAPTPAQLRPLSLSNTDRSSHES